MSPMQLDMISVDAPFWQRYRFLRRAVKKRRHAFRLALGARPGSFWDRRLNKP